MSNTNANTPAQVEVTEGAQVPEHQKNDKRMSDLMKQVRTFGADSGAGRDSLPKLAHAVVKAAADGVIDLDFKDKDGKDAAELIYATYVAGESKKAVHEHTTGGKKANESKLRQLIGMGAMTSIDAVEVMQDAFDVREKLKSEGEKVKPAYVFYIDVARAQRDTLEQLDSDALGDICLKAGPKAKDVEAVLKQVNKLLEGLVTGENRDKIKDTDELTEAAAQAIAERLKKFATLRATQKLREDAAKLGITLG